MAGEDKKAIKILHISDLHIGQAEGLKTHLLLRLDSAPSVLADTIKDIVEKHGDDFTVDFLVVTGDIISQAAEKEVRQARYKIAEKQLDTLWRAAGVPDKKHVLMTPGNHDVLSPKSDKEAGNCTRLDDYLDFVRSFYGGIPDKDNPSLLSLIPSDKGVEVNRASWSIPYEEGVVFWPFVTCDFTSHDENQDGVCSFQQLSFGSCSLGEIPNIDDMCCIAIAHHNFLPAMDTKIQSGRRGHSRKSMEALRHFFQCGVKIILHGHRHQDYVMSFPEWESEKTTYRNEQLLVGAPSIGYYHNTETIDDSTGKKKGSEDEFNEYQNSEHDLAGFAMLELDHHEESTNVTLKKYRLQQQQDGKWNAQFPDVRTRTLRRQEGLQEFMPFPEGYRQFASEILKSEPSDRTRRIIIMHYHDDTKWHNAFNRFWRLDIDDGMTDLVNRDLARLLRPIGRDVLKKNYLGTHLVGALHKTKLHSKIMRIVTDEISKQDYDIEKTPFLSHLYNTANKDTEGARVVTYIAEAVYCANNPNVDFRKHVYFSPIEEKRKEMRDKFIWLLESIMHSRQLKNFTVSWLPFSIAGYQGKSLVGIHDQHDRGHFEETFYVGFDPETDPHRNSVLRLPRHVNRNSAEGPILDDLKALMRKVINPLSQRLVKDFPIFANGKVKSSNLCCIALAIGAEDIWETELGLRFKRVFNIRPKRCCPQNRLIKCLDDLYAWVAGNGENSDWIPWLEEDKDSIMQSLKRK